MYQPITHAEIGQIKAVSGRFLKINCALFSRSENKSGWGVDKKRNKIYAKGKDAVLKGFSSSAWKLIKELIGKNSDFGVVRGSRRTQPKCDRE